MEKKIIIIGGGLAGLTLGIGLKQQGFHVKVFEAASHFMPLGGDIGLWPNGLEVLDRLGMYQDVLTQSGTYPSIKTGTEYGALISTTPCEKYQQIAPFHPINICRYELQDILVKKFGEQDIFFNKRCISIEEKNASIIAEFHDGTHTEAELLVGADGMNSKIRSYVDPNIKLQYAGFISLGGINHIPHQINFNLFYGKFLSGAFPVSQQRNILFFVTKHDDCNLNLTYPTLDAQFAIFQNHSPILDEMLAKLKRSVIENNQLKYFFVKNYNLSPLIHWAKGRAVLVGEAAFGISPILGCATSIILEGVEILIQALLNFGDDYQRAFASYEAIHQPRTKKLSNLERKYRNKFFNQELANYHSFDEELIACLKRDSNLSL